MVDKTIAKHTNNQERTSYDFGNMMENDDDLHSSTGSLNFQFQKEIRHNKLLPYAEELEAESQAELSEIKGNLGRAVMLREMEPGCNVWNNRLYKYIKLYGMKFSKEDHILFIKLMYELVIIPDLEPSLASKFVSTLTLLLKKKELISPDELELPWRPLYDLLQHIGTRTQAVLKETFFYYISMCNLVDALVHAVKPYFPVNATQEILDELKPMLCPFDEKIMCRAIEQLEWFLPVQLRPECYSIGHELWFNEFMNLWEICHNAPQWENSMMWLMARLASYNIGYINWEPHIPLMFTRFVRCLNLPVSYKKLHCIKHHKMDMTPIALWISSVLGNDSSAQTYLDKFMKTIETYFHPANFGRWLGKLKKLLTKLVYYFISRLHKERYAKQTWETPIPKKYKLTDNDVDAFVKSMMPVAMAAMFSKLRDEEVLHTLQYLATMRPSLVIPDVLERMYSTLDSLTEPHKLKAAMGCMVAVARPLVQGSRNVNKGYTYPEGPTHLLPLLFSSLPGIDSNDIEKCFDTFHLICVYFAMIPIVDSSRSSMIADEEERMICESTSRFEDFLLQFLDRVFLFIDSSSLEFVRLENNHGDGKSKLESRTEKTFTEACAILLSQTSDAIFESALHKLRTFVTKRNLETKVAGQLAAGLCQVFGRVNGPSTLRALVPLFCQTILDALDEGEDVMKEENLDNHLLHSMLLLSAVVNTAGRNLLPYIDTLLQVLDRVLLLKSKEGLNIACNLLQTILCSLTSVYPYKLEYCGKDYNDPDYPYVRDWGQSVDIESLNIKWYVPEDEEIAVIKKIVYKYLLPEVEKLQKYCEDWNTLSRDELLICLNIVKSVLISSESILPLWEEPTLNLMDSLIESVPFTPIVGMKGSITMPDASNVRHYMTGIISNVQQTILKHAEDDTKNLFTLIQIWNSLLLGKVRLRDLFNAECKNFGRGRKMVEDKLTGGREHLGPVIMKRVIIQHDRRVQFQSFNMTETHKRIMLELFTLSVSRYANIRSRAQRTLFSAFHHFPYAYTLIVSRLAEILGKDTDEHHDAYKGVLYLLSGPQESIITKRNWKMLKSLWPALVLSKTSEKFSVIRLKEKIIDSVHKYFVMPTSITLEIPERCLEIASGLWENFPQPVLQPPKKDEIEKSSKMLKKLGESNLKIYGELIDELLHAILKGNLQWRHRLMAMSFIKDLAHPQYIYPAKVVRYYLGALIHDTLLERELAIKTVVLMLQQQKRKHPKVSVDVSALCKNTSQQGNQSDNCTLDQSLDNSWLQYDYKSRPLSAEQWDEPRFVHKSYMGYYAWPKIIEVYAPSSEQPCLDPEIRKLTDLETEVNTFFNDPQNIEKLIKYFSLEEKKNEGKFHHFRCFLFKALFRNHGIVFLKHFLPHLHKLVADKQENSQRCAAEIIAGIIRGAKHWPFEMTKNMWDELLPIIKTALSNVTNETINDWGMCFALAQRNRDPNRHHWLLELLMEESPLGESESSFVECGRLYILQETLKQQLWRVSQLLQRLLTRLEDKLITSPFQILRTRLGSLLVTIFDPDLALVKTSDQFRPRTQSFIDKIVPRLQQLVKDNTVIFVNDEQNLYTQVANVSLSDESESVELKESEREGIIKLFKTVCQWVIRSVSFSQYGVVPAFYKLFPIACQLENCETDEELTQICSSTLAKLSQSLTLQCDMPIALETVTKMSTNSSWQIRSTSLEYLQVLIFHNMSIVLSNESWVDSIKDTVLCLLEDDRLEVREKAGQVLGGLLHCTFISDQEGLLAEFKTKATTRLHKKERSVSNQENTSKTAKHNALRLRHAGVLGLCAFIYAHPYDIPQYLPTIFEHLGPHMNDPQPIPTTIRRTLGDFKRTHYDGWIGHAQHFTEEQLAVLQDLLVIPSHYA